MNNTKEITGELLQQFADRARVHSAAQHAVAQVGLQQASVRQDVLRRHDYIFSIETPMGKITHQKNSGRCWMFAAMNAARVEVMKKLNVENFEFSKVYPLFWDKLEKANFFMENILDSLDEAQDSRLVAHLLKDPLQDGGQWDMYAGILEKYGAVPEQVMPETFHSSQTAGMVSLLTRRLRAWACRVRKMHCRGRTEEELRGEKEKQLAEIYQILVNCLGEPPRTFQYGYVDKEKTSHRLEEMTAKDFFTNYVGWNLADKISLIHAPTADKPYGRVYTVKALGSVQGAKKIAYLHVPMEVLKKATVASLEAGEPVWFGCDVGQYLHRQTGIMDLDLYDYESVAGKEPSFSKAERLDYGESVLTHAMVLTGVDIGKEGKPQRWRVENSWSDKIGHEGIFSMSDAWFDEFTYEVMVDRRFIPEEWLRAFEEPVIELAPWDPMGALAR